MNTVTRLTPIIIAFAAIASGGAIAQTSTPQPSSTPPCGTPEHAQFDFFLGRWNVYRSKENQLIGQSLVEKLYGGCAVREHWIPLRDRDGGGGFVSSWRPSENVWKQVWVDSSNMFVELVGRLEKGQVMLTGVMRDPSGRQELLRFRYRPRDDGSVHHTGEISSDNGRTWELSFDVVYRKT